MSPGRRAMFPVQAPGADDLPKSTVIAVDPRRFAIRADGGDDVVVDLSSWSHPSFAAEMAQLFREHLRRMGPTPIALSVRSKLGLLRRFWSFLDARELSPRGIGDVTVAVINDYEAWLEENAGGRIHQRHHLAVLIGMLRVAVDERPGVLSREVVARLTYLGHGDAGRSRPRDAYSSGIAEGLRQAARTQINEARQRIVLGEDLPAPSPEFDACPRLRAHHNAVVAEVARSGSIETRHVAFKRLVNLARRRNIDCRIDAPNARFHLTAIDLAAFLILVSLETGMEIGCLIQLKADCLRNPTKGYVEVEYYKRRARGSEWKRLRVRDGSSATPGGLLRLAIALTERARRHLGSDRLWALWTIDGLRAASSAGGQGIEPFVHRYQLVDDAGAPLRLRLSRLRKTHKAEWYRKTGGQLEQFAVGHSIAVAARHYADIPALRHTHEQTLAAAFTDAVDAALRPRIVSPDPDQQYAGADVQKAVAVAGEQDVWLARCGGFYASPFGTAGDPCPTPFWGCLECENAVISEQKLPALLAFQAFMTDQRAALSAEEWAAKFARPWHRVTNQILPAFTAEAVARAETTAGDAALLYLPVEATAQ